MKAAFANILLLVAFLLLSSCLGENPYLYDRPGFDAGDPPTGIVKNPAPMLKVAPPIYREQQNHAPQYYQQPYAVEQQYYQQHQQQAPAPYYQGQQGAQNPGSRYYSNPYSIPPAGNYYPPRYDQDQHYRPPTYYGSGQ